MTPEEIVRLIDCMAEEASIKALREPDTGYVDSYSLGYYEALRDLLKELRRRSGP